MKTYSLYSFFGMAMLLLSSYSCSSDLDFNQVNDLKAEPVIVANLSYFDIPASDFVDNGMDQYLSFDAQDFNVFRDKFFTDNLEKVDFDFEITNTINREYSFDIILLDKYDQVVHTIHFDIPASTSYQGIIQKTEKFENASLDALKKTKRMAFVLSMAAGPPLNKNSSGSLKLRSRATVYFALK
jgi:hypothetical protein